jgi:gmma-aminobutyric acid receptor subunit gamma/cGMP-dependent protein kinase 2
MLDSNDYVRCIFVDFSKAFDTINHPLLFEKLQQLPIQPNILLWIMNFLTGRSQAVKYDGLITDYIAINQSIVQGSGIGPVLYVIFASDLRTLSATNALSKYADDTTLISPQNTDVDIATEFSNLVDWAVKNKLSLNYNKTKEVVFRKYNINLSVLPAPLHNIERVSVVKHLGVFFTSRLSMDEHVNYILSVVNQRFYLLSQLKKAGLSVSALNIIFNALIVSRVEYALPCFAGFLSEFNRSRLNVAFRKAVRWGIIDTVITIDELVERSDSHLFKRVQAPLHCLNSLLPPPNPADSAYNLRTRGHSLTLPHCKKALFKNSFVMRTVYKYRQHFS